MANDPRGRWFRVYARQVRQHPKFRSLTFAELGAWTELRAAAELLDGSPFVDRADAMLVLQRRERSRIKCLRLLERLVEVRLLDDDEDGIGIHDLSDHDRPRGGENGYPSDSPEQRRERQARRRARIRTEIMERDGYACRYCGSTADPDGLMLDHVIPRVQAGPDTTDNLVASCVSCNYRKGGRTPEQAGMTLRPLGHDVTNPASRGHDTRARESRAEEPRTEAEPAADAMLQASELPSEDDSATLACRQLFDSGKWLGDREYVAAWEDMDRRYSPDWVQAEIVPAFAACLERRGKVLPWDLKRMTEGRLAERSRAEQRQREIDQAQREDAARAERDSVAASMSAEEQERQSLIRRAIGVWIKGGRKGKVPEKVDELREWLTRNGAQA